MRRRNFLAAGLALPVLAACGTGAQGSTSTKLAWGWTLPSTWDPVTSTVGNDVHALSLVYAAITKQDLKGNAVPALAESWKYNASGTEVTFTLRSGLTFSDDSALDAQAVRKSLLRGRDAPDSTIGAQLKVVKDIRVDSPTAVTLILDQADYQIPNLLAGKTGMIVNLAGDTASLATKPAGAGPFALKQYVPGSHAALVKNASYWDAENIHVEDFELKTPPDPTVAVAGLQSGQFDIAVIPPSQIEAAKNAGLEVDVITVLTVRVLDVNNTVKPFDNPKFLQAVSHAVNREELVDTGFFGQGEKNWQPFPKGYVAYNSELEDLYPYDADRAKQLLAEAGHPNGVDITLWTNAAEDPLAELLQVQLTKVGIRTKIAVVTPGSNNYVTRKYPFVLDSFSGRESPVQAMEVLFGPSGLMNLGRNSPPELATAIDKARATPLDSPEYPAVIQAATATAVRSMPNTFLFSWPRIFARKPGVSGFEHYIGTQRFEGVRVKQ